MTNEFYYLRSSFLQNWKKKCNKKRNKKKKKAFRNDFNILLLLKKNLNVNISEKLAYCCEHTLPKNDTFNGGIDHLENKLSKSPRGGGGGRHSPEKVVWICLAAKTLLSTPLKLFFRSPVAAWFSSLDPTLSQNIIFWFLREKFVGNLKNFQLCS